MSSSMVLVWPTDADQLLSSICPNGGSIAFTDFPLTIPDLNRVRDCGSMQASVSILPVLEGEAMCDLYQRYAGYCGCETGVAENSCHLCGNESSVPSAPGRELPIFSDLFGGVRNV